MTKGMDPDMSVNDMLNSFIFITKGSCVIGRRAIDWGKFRFCPRLYYKDHVYTLAEMKRLFAHRVVKSKMAHERRDPFQDWMDHPHRFTAFTLNEAMDFADRAAHGLIEPRIDVDAIILNAANRIDDEWRELNTQFTWTYNLADPKSGQCALLDPAPTPPPIQRTATERLINATRKRDGLREKREQLTDSPKVKAAWPRRDGERDAAATYIPAAAGLSCAANVRPQKSPAREPGPSAGVGVAIS